MQRARKWRGDELPSHVSPAEVIFSPTPSSRAPLSLTFRALLPTHTEMIHLHHAIVTKSTRHVISITTCTIPKHHKTLYKLTLEFAIDCGHSTSSQKVRKGGARSVLIWRCEHKVCRAMTATYSRAVCSSKELYIHNHASFSKVDYGMSERGWR